MSHVGSAAKMQSTATPLDVRDETMSSAAAATWAAATPTRTATIAAATWFYTIYLQYFP